MFFDLPESGERALLIHCDIGNVSRYLKNVEDPISRSIDGDKDSVIGERVLAHPQVSEFFELAKSADVTPIYLEYCRRSEPSSRFFIGTGKVAELVEISKANKIDVVLVNHALSPSQARNLEGEFGCRVIDRTGLILDIFAQRARSHAGKLQVELAQLEYISTRLIRGWTHLERQKGGIGLRGPGESQLETDRRLIRERIKWIEKRLVKVEAQHLQSRRGRSRAEIPTVALVGYTNAGKSTLFNALTDAEVYAKDQLFATLDTTLRALNVPTFGKLILADTVGFVQDLPHKLVKAFKATLEEAVEADLILHVVDSSADEVDEQIYAVEAVLEEIGAAEVPMVQVLNKIDNLADASPRIDKNEEGEPLRVWLSAKTGDGLPLLHEVFAKRLGRKVFRGSVLLSPAAGAVRAKLHEAGAILSETHLDDGGSLLELSYPEEELRRLLNRFEQTLWRVKGDLNMS